MSKDRRLSDAGKPRERSLDLARLYPDASDLQLRVGTAVEPQLAVGTPPDQISRPVHHFARCAERIGDEPLRRQTRPVQIPACDARARDVQLSDDAYRHQAQPGVQDIHTRVVDRPADRHRNERVIFLVRDERSGAVRLRGAVLVVQPPVVLRPPNLVDRPGQCEALTRLDDVRQRGQFQPGADRRFAHSLDDWRRRVEFAGLVTIEPVSEQGHVATGVVVRYQQATASMQRGEDFQDGHVEADHGEHRGAQTWAGWRPGPAPSQQIHHRAIGHHDPLGGTGGTRRVDQVGRVLGDEGRHSFRVCRVLLAAEASRGRAKQHRVKQQTRPGRRQVAGAASRRQHERGRGIGEHGRAPLGRIGRIHREVRRAHFEHCQHGGHQLCGALRHHRDDPLRPDPPPDQLVGDPVRPIVQLRVAQQDVAVRHGRRFRALICLCLDEFRD
ncbi:hypothetical protein A4R44_09309 [Amycolatopsis sp. M39]|nr:hypothetical protein A4R44_09309 [Amycolatopsis sp. M39]